MPVTAGGMVEKMKAFLGIALLATILAAPPVWAVWRLLTAEKLVAYEQVTIKMATGAVPEVAPILLVWLLFLAMTWLAVSGAMPRMRGF